MPTTKKGEDNSINDNDKTTLHDAGVDVAGLGIAPEVKDVPATDAPTINLDDSISDPESPDVKKTGIHFVSDTPAVNKEDLSALAEEKMRMVEGNSKDLEAEFRSELSSLKASSKSSSEKDMSDRSASLGSLLSKIQEKLGLKKKNVKDELSSLKKMKDSISKDISDIKNLEDSEGKIRAEIDKIESITKEVDAIEEEFGQELKD